MTYTADELIEIRKKKWEESHDIEYDKRLRDAIANEIFANRGLLGEIKRNPEKLIELVLVVVNKDKHTMPFFLNDVQHDFINTLNKTISDYQNGLISEISLLVLKGRQQGFTTLVTAYQYSCSILNRNFEGYTLADKSDNAEEIFEKKAKFPHGQMPDVLKPTEKFNNRKQLLFEKLNSSWTVDTATKDVGRSRTVNFFHGSECAFWKDGIAYIQGALGEALTKDCIKIYESTANGYNDFQKMWASGVHINCFYAWWRTKEYRIPLISEDAKREFQENIASNPEWIWQRLRWLRDDIGLDIEQLYWYWNKYVKYLDKDLIKQEYPCTPQEAFLLSGKSVFDTQKIIERLSRIKEPIKRGYFTYRYDGLTISNITWVDDKDGYIKLYTLPQQHRYSQYCIGGDTAGDGSDYFIGQVLDAKTGKQVAVLRHQFDADQYTRQMYCLGKYYKDALLGIEANFDSYSIRELQRLGYSNQYVRESIDTYTGKTEKKFGFKTTSITRPTILYALIEVVREHSDLLNDKDTLEEMLTVVKNMQGRIEAQEGAHDDLTMALAIAYEIRSQVVFQQEEKAKVSQYNFEIEREYAPQFDYGEEIMPI